MLRKKEEKRKMISRLRKIPLYKRGLRKRLKY